MRIRLITALSTLLLTAVTAHAHSGTAHAMDAMPAQAQTARIIEITMDDAMRFLPDQIKVQAGETVRLKIHNAGKLPHEIVLGKMDQILAHAKEMRAHPDMPPHHEANALTLDPGQSGELVWTFTHQDALDFACTLPGHYEAGMKGRFVIG
ncbi:cupredoxin domain-containing protein [Castellaniella sp.]|uniref:cupredoxin domain-containing protein n=1 Tax=Castellaniella sp. TaxID=1955812 RepID=UPI003C71D3C8